MKLFLICLASSTLFQSCPTNKDGQKVNSFLKICDELNIVYYATDTFVYKTTDSEQIRHFVDLISTTNEPITDVCEPTNKLIYKNKGRAIFTAQVSGPSSINCNEITYFINSKKYKHRLTYQTGQTMEEIYWHKLNPQSNAWPEVDTAKYHFVEQLKNNR